MLYGGAVCVRNAAYDVSLLQARKLPRPVVSVGNITVGGSGKTPFVMFLAERLLSLGRKPAILSRGYKRMTDKLVISCPGRGSEADVQMLGDEPALISQAFPDVPVAVHKDRYTAGLSVLNEYGADVFILDDGLQNRELHRDVDFVLLRNSLADLKDTYLPAGNLRDSKRRISQADVIVLTAHARFGPRTNDLDAIGKYNKTGVAGVSFLPSHIADHTGSVHPLSELEGKEVAAFCAVANPGQFFDGLEGLGAKISSRRVYRDHHWFDEYDLDEIFGGDEDLIAVTTPKDAVRLYLDDELSQRDDLKRVFALHEKAIVNFGLDFIDGAIASLFGGVHA